MVMIVVIIVVTVARRQTTADATCTAGELEDVHAIANAVYDDNVAAIIDFDVVGHVHAVDAIAALFDRGFRYIERRGGGALRVADVPRADAAIEVRGERYPAVIRIAEILLGRMGAEPLAAQAVVAARVFLALLRIDPQRNTRAATTACAASGSAP